LFKEIRALQGFIAKRRQEGLKIGFIPTMGSLHEGHLSLIRQSRSEGNFTICSIFINPTQFNQAEDFALYPRAKEKDIELLLSAGCDLLFHPEGNTMYPEGFIAEQVEYGSITDVMEGLFRPGHFNGVVTIVRKLLEVVKPDHLYMGQKDYQQCAVISQLIQRESIPVLLHKIPTIREPDGLAMSSRNARLTKEERQKALVISETLNLIKKEIRDKTVNQLKEEGLKKLNTELRTEYLEIVDPETLEPINSIGKGNHAIALIAAWCGNVRLIDNIPIA
jgi:pantoate--beta-alanine ligase